MVVSDQAPTIKPRKARTLLLAPGQHEVIDAFCAKAGMNFPLLVDTALRQYLSEQDPPVELPRKYGRYPQGE